MTTVAADRDHGARASIYNPLTLRLYDAGVLGLTNSLIWKCPTRHLEDLYRANVGRRHLDVGPGTGYYLRSRIATYEHVTLLDPNESSLIAARDRITQERTGVTATMHRQSLFDPLPHDERYDSIGLNFLFHCIPDPDKWVRLAELRSSLAPGGTVFGSTVILDRDRCDVPARALCWLYQRLGVFGNAEDTETDLAGALRGWEDVRVSRRGHVLVFSARRPKENP